MFKKILLIPLLILFASLPALAMSVGEVDTQGAGHIGIGFDGDYVINRKLSSEKLSRQYALTTNFGLEEIQYETDTQRPEIDWMHREAAKISYGILDNVDVYGTVGGSDMSIGKVSYNGTANASLTAIGLTNDTGVVDGELDYNIGYGLVWGGGVKAKYDLPSGWMIGCDAQYLRQTHEYDASCNESFNMPASGTGTASYAWKGTLTIDEWQASPYIAKKIDTEKFGTFVPLLGGIFGNIIVMDSAKTPATVQQSGGVIVLSDDSASAYHLKYWSHYYFGVLAALGYEFGEHWRLNMEGRFINETAVSGSISYRF